MVAAWAIYCLSVCWIVCSHSLTLRYSNLGSSGIRHQRQHPSFYHTRRRRKVFACTRDVNDYEVFDSSLEDNFDGENVEQDANTIFAKLLRSQLEIVVTATKCDSAAMFVDAGGGSDTNVGSMLMVCCYPPEGQDDDFDTSLGEQPLPGEARYTIPSPYRRMGDESSSVVTLGILQTLSSPQPQQQQSSSSSHNSYNNRVCSSVARSLGVSIVMEMARQTTLDEFTDNLRQVKAIESDAWLQSSSALLTARTLLKMVSNRLPDDDEIGREMIENALDQTESISEALTLLSHETDADGDLTGMDIEDYAQQYEEHNSDSSRKQEGEPGQSISSSTSSRDVIDVSSSSSKSPISSGSSSRSAVTASSPVDNAATLPIDLTAEAFVVVDASDESGAVHARSSFFSQRTSSSSSSSSSSSTAQNTARRREKTVGSDSKSSSSSKEDDALMSFISDGDGTVDEVWKSSKEEVAVSYESNDDEEKIDDE